MKRKTLHAAGMLQFYSIGIEGKNKTRCAYLSVEDAEKLIESMQKWVADTKRREQNIADEFC